MMVLTFCNQQKMLIPIKEINDVKFYRRRQVNFYAN